MIDLLYNKQKKLVFFLKSHKKNAAPGVPKAAQS